MRFCLISGPARPVSAAFRWHPKNQWRVGVVLGQRGQGVLFRGVDAEGPADFDRGPLGDIPAAGLLMRRQPLAGDLAFLLGSSARPRRVSSWASPR